MWQTSKRVLLFLLTNVAVLFMATLIVFLLRTVFGFAIPNSSLINILIFSAVIGFVGSFVSLFLSKWSAKQIYKIKILQESRLLNYTPKEQLVYTLVARIAKENGIAVPEVGIYTSPDVNAFATGASKNSSLVAVSSGLMEMM